MRRQVNRISFAAVTFLLLSGHLCLPTKKESESDPLVSITRRSFRGFVPSLKTRRLPRADNNGGIGGFLQTAAQDGIASTSAFTSPTLFVGGFSVMMQPLPNGTEFAGQLMEMLPHYANFLPSLPGLPGFGRQIETNNATEENSTPSP
ncbi:hypothetical protein RUM43_010264 [Polyplax serrata]|uniref:Uncharacterized protein n=1 Tax=Polyplax serrata TaxID=468196 RepID=A0AAN8PKL9_POLSC